MIKWGFIGCGDVVERKSGKPFRWEGKSDVVAVMSRNIENAKSFATRHNIKNYYNNADELINNPEVEAIYVATTPSSHMEYAKKAIMAGKPVYVEKPMGINTLECEEVLNLAKEKNVDIFVAYYRRGLPYFHEIKSMLDSGMIGNIRSLNVIQYTKAPAEPKMTWRRDVNIAGGGLFHDLACHTLDILDFLFGEIEDVYGFSANQRKMFDCEDVAASTFIYKSGVMATGLWCFDAAEDIDRVEVVGDNGIMRFPVYGNVVETTINGETITKEIPNPAFVQEPIVHNVISSLLGEEKPLSTGVSAMRTVKVMDKIVSK